MSPELEEEIGMIDLEREREEDMFQELKEEQAFENKMYDDEDFALEHAIETFGLQEAISNTLKMLSDYGYELTTQELIDEL